VGALAHRLADTARETADLSGVDAASFTTNGVLSAVMCLLFLFAKMHAAL